MVSLVNAQKMYISLQETPLEVGTGNLNIRGTYSTIYHSFCFIMSIYVFS